MGTLRSSDNRQNPWSTQYVCWQRWHATKSWKFQQKSGRSKRWEMCRKREALWALAACPLMGLGRPRRGQAGLCVYGWNLQGTSGVKLFPSSVSWGETQKLRNSFWAVLYEILCKVLKTDHAFLFCWRQREPAGGCSWSAQVRRESCCQSAYQEHLREGVIMKSGRKILCRLHLYGENKNQGSYENWSICLYFEILKKRTVGWHYICREVLSKKVTGKDESVKREKLWAVW